MRAQMYNQRTGEHRTGGEELIAAWREDTDCVLWADYQTVSDTERVEHLERAFGLHPMAIQDALRDRHPPKCESFESHLFIRIRGLDADTEDIAFRTIDISLFAGPRLLVTRRTGLSVNTEALWHELAERPAALAVTEHLAISLIGRVIRRYVNILLAFEPRLDALESDIFEEQGDELLVELTGYKTRLKQLRRILQYHDHVVLVLKGLCAGDEMAPLRHEVEDVHDQTSRALSLSELYYELTDDLVNAYLALSAHRLNQVMRVLTIVAVIFMPLGLLAGIYGMNFENIPELKARYGYYSLLTTMGIIIVAQLYYFRRRGWLWN